MTKKPRKGFLQKLGFKHHEYWSWWLLVIPIWPLWIWYAFRLRCATWFTAVNPSMEDSGFVNESKITILNLIPDYLKPNTLFVPHINEFSMVIQNPYFSKNNFPLIAKPDIGGRGRKVAFIKNLLELRIYHEDIQEDYMVQEVINYETELGIFYIRIPNEPSGRITSIALKDFLKVKGDGKSSIEQLMKNNYRASLQIERLRKTIDLKLILPINETRLLEPIGNHSRGTTFVDAQHLINEKLNNVFNHICGQIPNFYYGRFDIRVKSIEDLYEGQHIFIMELNGLTSDAVHIFDPNARLRDAYKTQIVNCKLSYQIAKQNISNGTKPTPLFELIKKVTAFLQSD
jgi:hypothetical protein